MQAHRGRIPWATIACTCILGSVGLKLDLTEATPYNPHVANGMQPWFEGWYTRVTADSGLSFAAVTGSFPEQSLSYPAAFAGVLFQPHKGRTRTYQEFPPALHVTGPGGQPVHQQPDLLSDADFALHASDESFNLTIGGSDFSMSAATEGALLTVEGAGPLIRWGPTPGDTPEGAAAKLPFVNLHWYVYSLATPVNWTFHDPQLGPETLSGQGWAHMEKNWGRAFPDEWVWAQGLSLNKQASSQSAVQAAFVMAGGPAPIKSTWLKLPKAWLIGFYSSKLGHWHFTPSSPSVYKVDSDACSGTFQIQATSLRRKMVLKLHAATDGFAPLQCPTAIGFHIESVESFSGHAHIEAYEYQFWPWREVGWKLVEVVDMENTALEFGGNYRCQSQEQRSCDSNI